MHHLLVVGMVLSDSCEDPGLDILGQGTRSPMTDSRSDSSRLKSGKIGPWYAGSSSPKTVC